MPCEQEPELSCALTTRFDQTFNPHRKELTTIDQQQLRVTEQLHSELPPQERTRLPRFRYGVAPADPIPDTDSSSDKRLVGTTHRRGLCSGWIGHDNGW